MSKEIYVRLNILFHLQFTFRHEDLAEFIKSRRLVQRPGRFDPLNCVTNIYMGAYFSTLQRREMH